MRDGEEGKKNCPSSCAGSGQAHDNSSSQLPKKSQPGKWVGAIARIIVFVAMAFKPSSISFFSLLSFPLPPHHVFLHPPLIA